MVKKVLIGVGVVIGLVILTALILPFVIDADKFRPQIVQAVEENLNADLELGKLKLSLWGGLHIQVERMNLSEKGSQGQKPVFAMKDARLEISLLSLLTGRPNITVAVKKPLIRIVSGFDGKLNVAKLPKSTGEAPQETKKSSPGAAAALPFVLSFKIEDGQITYIDEKLKTKTDVTGFNFNLRKFGLNKPFDFELKTHLDVKQMKELTLKGSLELEGQSAIYMNTQGLEKLELNADADLSDLLIKYGSLLNKSDKVAMKAGLTLESTPKNLKIDRGHFQMGDAAIDVKGTVDNFDAPVVNMTLASTKFIFENWQSVIGPLKDFDMKGNADFKISLSGPVSKLSFNGKAQADNMSLQAPGIVPRVTDMRAQLNFSNDTASITKASLKMGQSDLAMEGFVKNFLKPVIQVNVNSQLLDVDSLLPQKSPEQKKAEAAAAKKAQSSGKSESVDVEAAASGPITAMKKNPTARAVDFTGKVKVKRIVVNKAEITDLDTEMTFKELVMNLKKASAKAFGGGMNFNAGVDFRGQDPAYNAVGDVAGIDINAAVTSQMPPMKDTIMGKIFSKFTVSGSGLSKPKAKATMKGNGNFRIDNGSWSALQVMKGLGEKLKSIPGAGDKVGQVNVSGKFRHLKSDFNILAGRFNILNMMAEMEEANTGATGQGFVDFDMNLSLAGRVLVPGGGDMPPELKHSDGRGALPYEIGCQATSPCLRMEGPGQVIAKAYLKKEGSKALKNAVEKIDNPQVKELLKKLPF